jgi:hypothetical protein
VGFIAGYIIPVTALSGRYGAEVYNAYFLLMIATLSGFQVDGWLRHLVAASDVSVDRAVAVKRIKRITPDDQLVQFRGFLTARLIDGDNFESCMVGDKAQLRSDVSGYRLELTLQPEKADDGVSVAIVIEEGTRAPSATFDIEVVADGLEPTRNVTRITGTTGKISESTYLSYSLPLKSGSESEDRLRLSVRQRGRIIQYASMQLVPQ